MSLIPGTKLGPYEIVSPLGAGGMGEVYRARDARLERTVAVKILPAHLSDNPQAKQRFEREARAISSLSHPNICHLYDVGRQDGIDFIVMEFLEGETLADRLRKGPLPPEQVLKYGIEICEGLEKAHRSGVIHRDLKPGNIMLTKSGAKLMDFGLAKATTAGAALPSSLTMTLSHPPTDQPLTAQGMVVGTFQYMAPEQLEGKDADSRTDIFALGAVLYEMATGRPAFAGNSRASLIAAIFSSDPPPISTVQSLAPPHLERVVKTCLAKDPDERFQTAHDLKLQLQWSAEGSSQAGVPPVIARRLRKRERLAWASFIGMTIVALVLGLRSLRPVSDTVRSVRFFVSAPAKATYNFIGRDAGPATVSPDGSHLAFAATTAEGKKLLFVHSLDSLSSRALDGTDGASYPFWSPDSRFLAFFADGKLKKIEITGGPVQTLGDAPLGRGGTWNRDGVIVFAPDVYVPLERISSTGGELAPATRFEPGSNYSHRWPQFLPDGRHFIYLSFSTVLSPQHGYAVHVGSLDRNEDKILLQSAAGVAYSPPGYLLYLRERTLMAIPFDVNAQRITGEPFAIAEQIQCYPNTASAVFSASQNGVLAYQAGASPAISQMVRFDAGGRKIGSVGPPGDYEDARLSWDGNNVAAVRFDSSTGTGNIWLYEPSRDTAARFTFDPSFDHSPVWSPDGHRLVFDTNRNGPADLYQKSLRGNGDEVVLLHSNDPKTPTDWSADSRFILYQQQNEKKKYELWILPVSGDRKPHLFLKTESNVMGGQFSPDGRWIAYSSDASGRWEVYAASFPGPGGKWQISTAGGTQPRWRRDGKQIFYLAADRQLMVADVNPGTSFEFRVPKPLFETRSRYTGNAYDVFPDGQRFLINTILEGETSSPVTVVLHWTAELRQ